MLAETKDFSSIPAISIAGLGRDAAATDRIGAEIGRACESADFFYVVDHGVPHGAIDASASERLDYARSHDQVQFAK